MSAVDKELRVRNCFVVRLFPLAFLVITTALAFLATPLTALIFGSSVLFVYGLYLTLKFQSERYRTRKAKHVVFALVFAVAIAFTSFLMYSLVEILEKRVLT